MGSEFNNQVAAQLESLKTKPLLQIEAEVSAKRQAWLQARNPSVGQRPTPRLAFEMLFFEYMGLHRDELHVLKEDEREIVWSSHNPCPTLVACNQLGLDTRVVCRMAYEKSTQAFVSWFDPELRFLRDYSVVRPRAPYCLERIIRVDFEAMMRLAIEEAQCSRAEGNKGYGAVVALGERVLARGHDTAITECDPSLHAEVNTIRAATHFLRDSNLSGAILFSSCEPCPMCSSLAVWANVSAIVFGASIQKTAARGRTRIMVPVQEVVGRSPASNRSDSGHSGNRVHEIVRMMTTL